MSFVIIGGTKVVVGQMSYFILVGTNVAVGQMSGGTNVGGTNVGGTNVGGTLVCGTKVAPPLFDCEHCCDLLINFLDCNLDHNDNCNHYLIVSIVVI